MQSAGVSIKMQPNVKFQAIPLIIFSLVRPQSLSHRQTYTKILEYLNNAITNKSFEFQND